MTARVADETYAANLALGHCGQPELADWHEDNKRARAVRRFFPTVRDELLREKWWSFATGWVKPAADPSPAIGRFKTRYALPADYVRVRFVAGADGEPLDDLCGAWDIENGAPAPGQVAQTYLVTNVETPTVCYTRRIEDVRLWDPVFLTGFAYRLGAALARTLNRNKPLSDTLEAMARDTIATAAAIDSKEKSPSRQRPVSSWLRARSGFRSPRW